ncbi:MAG: cobalamin-dependent protein, partial [Desulfobulbus sp.]|nr:cobalamin-dependent protein [Desulfobulbus sp.]
MSARFLLVNCASPYFFYIPMGSFGLCDALSQQGIAAKIFNPALYPEAGVRERLLATLVEFDPTHVGFVCHWQETVHGLLATLAVVREWNPTVPTLGGGFTAAYFAEDLLRTVPELDCVVTGDPEEPVACLLRRQPPAEIANLVWREQGAIRRSDRTWLIDRQQLDQLAFGDCSYLIDAELYIRTINTKLGFPLLLGRGCAFDCAYCGGSRHAFRLHSGRRRPVSRSIAAIIADLHRLKPWTRILYICYENDPGMVKHLLRAIADDPLLRGHFLLHYGAWRLLDAEFLELYQGAFARDLAPPIIEFSPEVTDDRHRAAIKRGTTYNLVALEANIGAIVGAFDGQVRIEVFFSRYHPVLGAAELEREAGAMLMFAHRMARQGLPVHVSSDHLSTDVASRYWEECQDRPRDFARFLARKTQLDEGKL